MATNLTSPVDVGASPFTPLSTLDVASAGSPGVAIGSYAGANAAPADGLIVSGPVGIGSLVSVPTNPGLVVSGPGMAGTILAATTDGATDSSSAAVLTATADTTRVSVISHGSARVVSRYGLTLGGWAEASAINIPGQTSNGLVIGVQAASPLVLGTDNLERARIDGAGNVHVSSLSGGGVVTSTSGVLGVTAAAGIDTTAIHNGSAASGDLTGSYPNPTLAAIGSASGPIGSPTSTPVVTIDAKGRVTALTAATISGISPGGTASGDLSGTYPAPTVARLQGKSVSNAAPSVGNSLRWSPNGSPEWTPLASGFVYPEDYGAGGTGITDDSAAIAAAISACTGGGTVALTGTYAIGTTTVNFACPVWSTSSSKIIPYGSNTNGITISGGSGVDMKFGYIGGFSAYAINLKAAVANIEVNYLQGLLSGQGGVGVLCTNGAATCDIHVIWMTNFTSCVAFQNGTNVGGLQGLRFSINFADNNLYGLNFDGSDNCDANLIKFGTWDFDIPSGASTGTVWFNSNSSSLNNALANCQLDIEDWCGNGAPGGTVGNNALALGAFIGCRFNIGNAGESAGTGTYAWDFFNISGSGSGNNSVAQSRRSSLGSMITGNWQKATGSRSSFASTAWYVGGIYCTGTWTTGTIAPGASITMYVYTPFTAAHLGASWNFRVSGPLGTSTTPILPGTMGGGLVCTQIYDNSSAGASQTEEIILVWTNASSSTVAINTVISFNLFAF